MKRTAVWTIVMLMSIALIGLASFQVYWINNTIQLNKQTFNENVISSLQQVAINLERREAARLASENLNVFYESGDKGNIKFLYREERITKDGKKQITVNGDTTLAKRHFIRNGTSGFRDSIIFRSPQPPLELSIPSEVDSLKQDANQRFISRSHMVNVVIEQLTNPNSLDKRVNHEELDSMLSTVFKSNGINIPYEFAVWNQSKDSMIMGNVSNYYNVINSQLKSTLYPSDLINDMNLLLVNFPGRSTYLFKQIWGTLLASLLFILIIVSCFIYAIFIIFKQKKLSEMKNDFINNMTHELKTPIATVGLAVEALGEREMRSDESVLLRYLGMIKEENNRLSVQVEKVLQSAILEKESFHLNSDSLNLHELINKAVEKVKISLEDREGNIGIELNASNDLVVGDAHHLTNVIVNILDNAIKYSITSPELKIRTTNNSQTICVELSDKGMGMEQDTVKHIFEKFYRAHTGDRHDVKGFGLGLSYVKTIVERHKGNIIAHSQLGVGTTFTITLPNG